jgi:hypothetical protein
VQVSHVWLHFRRGIFTSTKEGTILIKGPDRDLYGTFPVSPGQMADAIAHWLLSPPFPKTTAQVTVRVCVIDQFGNRCSTDKIRLLPVADVRRLF